MGTSTSYYENDDSDFDEDGLPKEEESSVVRDQSRSSTGIDNPVYATDASLSPHTQTMLPHNMDILDERFIDDNIGDTIDATKITLEISET